MHSNSEDYGADGVRFGMLSCLTRRGDLLFDEKTGWTGKELQQQMPCVWSKMGQRWHASQWANWSRCYSRLEAKFNAVVKEVEDNLQGTGCLRRWSLSIRLSGMTFVAGILKWSNRLGRKRCRLKRWTRPLPYFHPSVACCIHICPLLQKKYGTSSMQKRDEDCILSNFPVYVGERCHGIECSWGTLKKLITQVRELRSKTA